jgi:uncharacterized protein (DUF169 family)
MMGTWSEFGTELRQLLSLKTFPIGWRRIKTPSHLEAIKGVRRIDHPVLFCQVVTLARTNGWTVGVTREQLGERCKSVTGFYPSTEEQEKIRIGYWLSSEEDAREYFHSACRTPFGNHHAIVMAPLFAERFDPEVILIYGTPAQLMMLLCGLQRIKFERFHFFFSGESACTDSISQCLASGRPALTLPCYGERRYGNVAEDEVVLALPPASVAKEVEGLKALSAVGLRYPIPPYGIEADPTPAIDKSIPKHQTYYPASREPSK